MTTINNDEIISKFKKALISISKVECKGCENGMICTIYRGTPLYFPSYYTAYYFYNSKNLL
jgi:hypothetical protein